MLTFLKYAVVQLEPIANAQQRVTSGLGRLSNAETADRAQRALEALEHCIEAAQIAADKQAAWDAETDAMIEELCTPAPSYDLGGEG